ncbi:MAG: restriction endonuclease subunit S [Saprospirales bacterium]|nr:MAG: restriction endonuclease subunit S [Saprospirales bacterium]
MSEWKEIKLGDLGTVVTGKTPSKNNPEDWGNDTLFITPSDYRNYRKWADDSIRKLSADGAERLFNKVLPVGSILVTCIGSDMGKVVMNREDAITNQQINSIIPNTDVVNSDFAYYLLVDLYETLRIYGGDGTAVPIVNKGDFEKIDALIPEKDEQRAIASVLSSLDDKIDLLHRQNQTLEQMAETLFRQWFVEEADEGWEEATIADYAEHTKISIKPSANPLSIYAHYSIPGFDNDKEPIHELGQEIRSNKYQVFKYTILFSKLNPHKDKRVWLILGEVPENAICSTEFQVVKPYNDNHLYFLYGWLSNSDNYREISSGVGGTSGSHQRISPNEIFTFSAPRVSDEVLEDYANSVKPIFLKQQINQTQIRTLTALRDTLLPKLMSGEVQVVDIPVHVLKKSKEARPEFKEAILIAAIVRTLFTPKIGSVSRQWYQKIAYLHKRKLKEQSEQQSVFELTTEYSKKAAGPYKKKMRYQGPEGICLKNRYLVAVNDYAFMPSEDIHKIDNYFDKYWNKELFENWTMKNFRFVPVKKLGVYATVDYSLLELKKEGKELSAFNVLDNISESKDWKHKKDLPEFSAQNIEQAIIDLKNLYTY